LDAESGGVAEARYDPAITNAVTAIKTMPAHRHNFRFSFITLILCWRKIEMAMGLSHALET